ETSGGGSGQEQLSAVSGSQNAVCVPPLTLFEQVVQRWGNALALAGVKSRAALNNIAPKLDSTSIFFFIWLFSLSLSSLPSDSDWRTWNFRD
ncbi:MAG TPA: hypothetical protein VG759_02440, partial [Candidatus Angelobacter sp.]|nr:hypothetical protein [Candidatus Angelobacter sp.]